MKHLRTGETRREFLKQTTLAATALAGTEPWWAAGREASTRSTAALPWYRRTLRWGQTNITIPVRGGEFFSRGLGLAVPSKCPLLL